MNRIAKFEKISYEQFKKDWIKKNPTSKTVWTDDEIKEIYDNIKLPKRSTTGSAGYDMFLPININIEVGESIIIPTGIRCKMEEGWVLKEYPRSGHGFKFGIHLANTVGIIDADYYNADNEGHIQIKIVNDSSFAQPVILEADTAFCQGIFVPFGITVDDEVEEKRIGGFGSTDKK